MALDTGAIPAPALHPFQGGKAGSKAGADSAPSNTTKKKTTAPVPAPPPPQKQRKQNWLEEMRNSVGRSHSSRRQANPDPGQQEGPGARSETGPEAEAGGKEPSSQFKVLYRYNEGYTNAVKKPLIGKELF